MSWKRGMLFALLALAACGEPEPIRIGFLGGLSGRFADFGTSGRNGVALAIEEQNAAGGIAGRRIELIVRDDRQDPDVARQAVSDLLNLKVRAIVGPMLSTIAVAVVPRTNDARVALISPTVTTTMLSGHDDYFFRITGTTANYARGTARFHLERFHTRSAALALDLANRDYSESWAAEYQKEFEAKGGKVLATVPFDSRGFRQNHSDIARALLRGNPDTIVFVCSSLDAALLAQIVRRLNRKVLLTSSGYAGTDRLIELGGLAVEGMLTELYADRFSSDPAYLRFREKFVGRYGNEPGFTGTTGYDAATAVFEALRRDPSGDIKVTLDRMRGFRGVQGEIVFDQYGDAIREPYFAVIRSGSFIPAK